MGMRKSWTADLLDQQKFEPKQKRNGQLW